MKDKAEVIFDSLVLLGRISQYSRPGDTSIYNKDTPIYIRDTPIYIRDTRIYIIRSGKQKEGHSYSASNSLCMIHWSLPMQGKGAGLVEEADALLLAEFADEQVAVLLHDNISVEALHHHLVEHGGVYDGVVRLVEVDIVANGHVAVLIGVGMFAQGVPTA